MEAEEIKVKSKAVAERLTHFLSSSSPKHIECLGVYAPLPEEVNWNPNSILSSSYKTAYPYFSDSPGETMEFYLSRPENLQKTSRFNRSFFLPFKSGSSVVPDLILVPGLRFSTMGQRLGRGMGYYDRYLHKAKDILSIGLCFEKQILDPWPLEQGPWDQDVHYVVTEVNLYPGRGPMPLLKD